MDHHWSPCIHLQLAKDAIWSTSGWPWLTMVDHWGRRKKVAPRCPVSRRSDRSDVGPPKRTSRVVSGVVSQIYLCRFLNNSFNHNWAWEEVHETSWRGLTVWRCSLIGNHWKQEMNNWPQVNKSAMVSVCSLGLSTWAYSIKHHETTIFIVKIMINIDDIDEHL